MVHREANVENGDGDNGVYGTLVRNARDGMCLADVDSGRMSFSNAALGTIFGYEPGELDGTSIFDLQSPEDPEQGRAMFERVSRGEIVDQETWLRRRDGSRICIEVTPRLVEVQGTQLVMSTVRDITESKRTEEKLVEREDRLHKIFDHSNDAIFIMDPLGDMILDVNPRACEMLGYLREELLARKVSAIHPTEMPAMVEFARSVSEAGHGWTDELSCTRKDGGVLPIELSASVIDIDGRSCLLAMIRDISARRRAEHGLRESEGKYRDLVENAFDIINSIAADGEVIEVNRKMAETMGYTVEELERMNVRDFVAPEHVELVLEYIAKTIDKGSASGLECDWIARDGHRIPMEINSTARYSESGAFIATRCIVRDVTIRRRMEARLVESEKLRATAEMSAGVGHNFNNLLTVIYARTRAIQAAAGDTAAVVREAKAIDAVVKDASALARRLQSVPSGPLADTAPVDIGRLVTEVVEMTRPRWQDLTAREGRQVDLDTELAETPDVIGSAPALREVLTNLIYNAVDAMPEGGTCTIRTAEQAGYVVISVSDTGTGMDDETKRRLFEPFFTTKAHGTGTGLGLFTVYHIIKQHGGTVAADASVGSGTTFSVRLPVAQM